MLVPTLHCRIPRVGRHCTGPASEPTTSFQVCCVDCLLCLPHLDSSGKIETHHPIVAALVSAGANVNAQASADGATPLAVASYYDSGWAVLLEAGADPTVAATCVCAWRLTVVWIQIRCRRDRLGPLEVQHCPSTLHSTAPARCIALPHHAA